MVLRLARIAVLILISFRLAGAQSAPGFVGGQIPTAAQLNAAFAAKQDYQSSIASPWVPAAPATALAPNSVLATDAQSHLFFSKTLPLGATIPSPVFSGNLATGILQGSFSILTTGTVSAANIAATPSLTLDSIGSTPGGWLYRGASAWAQSGALTGIIKAAGTAAPSAAVPGADYAGVTGSLIPGDVAINTATGIQDLGVAPLAAAAAYSLLGNPLSVGGPLASISTVPVSWVPTDASGCTSGCPTFSAVSASEVKVGRLCFATIDVTYSSTSDTHSAALSLPPLCGNSSYTAGAAIGYTSYGSAGLRALIQPSMVSFWLTGGSSATNANLSTDRVVLTLVYPTSS